MYNDFKGEISVDSKDHMRGFENWLGIDNAKFDLMKVELTVVNSKCSGIYTIKDRITDEVFRENIPSDQDFFRDFTKRVHITFTEFPAVV